MKLRFKTETMFPTLAERCEDYVVELEDNERFSTHTLGDKINFIRESKLEFERLVKLYGYDTEQTEVL